MNSRGTQNTEKKQERKNKKRSTNAFLAAQWVLSVFFLLLSAL
jgi:hypothetical protein